MKKIMISVALFATLFASCTTESNEMISEMESQYETAETNRSFFDTDEARNEDLFRVCVSIIEIHKDIDYFREILSDEILAKIDTESYTLDEAIFIILIWNNDNKCGDVLCEWPDMDDFWALYQ